MSTSVPRKVHGSFTPPALPPCSFLAGSTARPHPCPMAVASATPAHDTATGARERSFFPTSSTRVPRQFHAPECPFHGSSTKGPRHAYPGSPPEFHDNSTPVGARSTAEADDIHDNSTPLGARSTTRPRVGPQCRQRGPREFHATPRRGAGSASGVCLSSTPVPRPVHASSTKVPRPWSTLLAAPQADDSPHRLSRPLRRGTRSGRRRR